METDKENELLKEKIKNEECLKLLRDKNLAFMSNGWIFETGFDAGYDFSKREITSLKAELEKVKDINEKLHIKLAKTEDDFVILGRKLERESILPELEKAREMMTDLSKILNLFDGFYADELKDQVNEFLKTKEGE